MTRPDKTELLKRIDGQVGSNTERVSSIRKTAITLVVVIAAVLSGALLNFAGPTRAGAYSKMTSNATGNRPTKRLMNRPLAADDMSAPRANVGGKAQRRPDDSLDKRVRLPGEVPAALGLAVKLHGTTAGDQPLSLTVALNRKDQKGFDEFLRGVQNPKSPSYRHYLTPRQQADRFGPTQLAYDEVRAWLRRKGFSLVEGSANRLTLTVRGTRKLAEAAFGVEVGDYRSGDRVFYANDRDPVVPTRIAPYVQAVVGLSNLAKPSSSSAQDALAPECGLYAFNLAHNDYESCLRAGSDVSGRNSPAECEARSQRVYYDSYTACLKDPDFYLTGNGPDGGPGFSAPTKDIKPPLTFASTPWGNVTGAGQTIGLLEFDTFNLQDVKDYLALIASSPTTINRLTQVHVNGGASLGLEEAEVLIDIVAAMTNAPGANVVVYDAPFTGIRTSFQTLFNRMIGDGVTIISNSWVYCEDQTTAADAQSIDSVLASAAAAGITVLNSAGDFGSTCVNGSGNTISIPASSPHATAIGGTSLTVGPAKTYGSEQFWNGLNNTPPTGQGGYGVSRFFSRPAYQNGFTSSPMRSIPDVAVNADPAKGIRICQADAGGCPTGAGYGGTSLSAPLWAAFVALLNQAQGQNLGELNPLIYPLGNTSAFHTAASMGSDFQHVGLGSPNLNLIHRALTGITPGPVSNTISEIAADPNGALADGTAVAFVVVRLRDLEGHTVNGKTVTLAGNAGSHATITPASGVSNVANGAVIFSVKDTVPEVVTFTATDTTDGVVLQKQATVIFVTRPAAAGGISASPTTVTANGSDMTTITVTLQDADGNPSPDKLVNLSQGNGASIISATNAMTDATGKAQFTAVSNKAETVTYNAVDVTDRNLPVPGSASVAFVNASGFCADFNFPTNFGTAAPGYSVTTFASNFPIDCFSGLGPIGIAFNGNGTLLVGDTFNGTLYAFGQQGGIAGPATKVGVIQGTTLGGLTFTSDGRLYAALKSMNKVAELNPSTGAVIRMVVDYTDPIGLAVDPISGDLFVSSQNGVARISNFASGPGTLTPFFSGDVDGMIFGPDGTLYGAAFNQIIRATGTNTPMPGMVSTVVSIPNADGIALEPTANPAKPILYVNRKDGIITRIDTSALPDPPPNPCGGPCADIYTGGSRGDFVAVSPAGCLYATQSERVIKITKADGTCSLAPTSLVPQLSLTPQNVQPSPAQGTTVTFTAQLKNVAKPADIPITLMVSGANPTPRLMRADADGKAVFTHTGVATGTDRAFASADLGDGTKVFSNESQVTWTPGKHSTFLTLNQSPSSGAPNQQITLTATLVDISASPAAAIGGASVTFSLAGQMCMAATNGAGTASCSVTPAVAKGSYPLNGSFAGSSTLLPSSASKTVTLIERPATKPMETDLSVNKTATSTVGVGGDITCTITVTNNGPVDASNVVLTDNLPSGTTFVSETQTSGPSFGCSTPMPGAGGTVQCTIATLASGTSAQFTIKVRTSCSTASPVSNTATVSSSTADPNTNNNVSTATTTVTDTQPPALSCPGSVISVTPNIGGSSAVVTYPTPTASDNCPGATVACNPPSGSTFPVGCTTVACTATDASGNTASCSFQVCVFNICLQDDSNANNRILINSATGDYRFCCNGLTFTGKGKMTIQGSTFTLEHNTLDRRVRASITGSARTGNASLQAPPGKLRCNVTDSDTTNNTNCTSCQ